jgi:Ca2+-binding RTX toxin-like protein
MRMLRVTALFGLCLAATGVGLFAPGSLDSASAVVATCKGRPATIADHSGTIIGTSGPDVIVGGSDDNVIKGNGGNDLICGGLGNDTINGNTGNDEIYGDFHGCLDSSGPNDTVRGDAGDDLLVDYCGTDNLLDGGSGADRVEGTGTSKGGAGDDIYVYVGNFEGFGGTADGGSGDDQVEAGTAGMTALGGSGNDTLIDFRGSPVRLDGGSGNDICLPFGNDDQLRSCEQVGASSTGATASESDQVTRGD